MCFPLLCFDEEPRNPYSSEDLLLYNWNPNVVKMLVFKDLGLFTILFSTLQTFFKLQKEKENNER